MIPQVNGKDSVSIHTYVSSSRPAHNDEGPLIKCYEAEHFKVSIAQHFFICIKHTETVSDLGNQKFKNWRHIHFQKVIKITCGDYVHFQKL